MGAGSGGGGNGGRSGGGGNNSGATIPIEELGTKLIRANHLEDLLVKAQSRKPWEPEVKLPASRGEMRAEIEKIRSETTKNLNLLTPEAAYEVRSEMTYWRQTRGRVPGPTKDLKKLISEGKVYKK